MRVIDRMLIVALLSILALLHHARPANAADTLRPVAISAYEVAAVSGAAPSKAHSLGTLILAWTETVLPLPHKVTVAEWGIAEQKLVARRVLRSCKDDVSCTPRLARSADRVIVLIGGYGDSDSVPLEIISLGLDLTEKKAVRLGTGASPILDADGRFILAGAWERRPPVVPPIDLGELIIQPDHVLSLRVLDPSTLQIVGSRVFRGTHLLSPNLIMTVRASRAARIGGGGAWVALPEDELHVHHVQLPSLATNTEKAFPRLYDARKERPTSGLEVVGSNVLVIGDHLRLLSPTLAMIAEGPGGNSSQYAYDATSNQLFADAGSQPSIGGVRIRENAIGGDHPAITWAFGRRIVVANLPPDEVATSTPNAHWGVAVIP